MIRLVFRSFNRVCFDLVIENNVETENFDLILEEILALKAIDRILK